jgi:RimJ/RimL family protein N-acetyltransferase
MAAFATEPGRRFRAEVKADNQPSASVFQRLGFMEVEGRGGLRVFERG